MPMPASGHSPSKAMPTRRNRRLEPEPEASASEKASEAVDLMLEHEPPSLVRGCEGKMNASLLLLSLYLLFASRFCCRRHSSLSSSLSKSLLFLLRRCSEGSSLRAATLGSVSAPSSEFLLLLLLCASLFWILRRSSRISCVSPPAGRESRVEPSEHPGSSLAPLRDLATMPRRSAETDGHESLRLTGAGMAAAGESMMAWGKLKEGTAKKEGTGWAKHRPPGIELCTAWFKLACCCGFLVSIIPMRF
mmetsp:Transcript_22720/g.52776  ORF Transcript_22720/g.52776 Transcript_22720/m.52776 type:complete len:248 (+) Transcript_22720:79-822(+)